MKSVEETLDASLPSVFKSANSQSATEIYKETSSLRAYNAYGSPGKMKPCEGSESVVHGLQKTMEG